MAFKIGRKAKSNEVNPFRPEYGLPSVRRYTVCRITDGSDKAFLFDMSDGLPIRIDCDTEELFVREMVSLIPKNEIWRDKDLEVWQVAENHLDLVINLAMNYFEEVKVERNGTIEKLRSPDRVDLMDKPGVK